MWRNKEVQEEEFLLPAQPWRVISQQIGQYRHAVDMAIDGKENRYRSVTIQWEAASQGWVIINTDRASKQVGGKAGCGGLCRTHDGQWICGFSCNLGSCTAFIIEIWGVLEGLKLAAVHGFSHVELQVDSMVVVNILQGRESATAAGRCLIEKIRQIMQRFTNIRVRHVYREANICADILAGLGCDYELGIRIYENAPSQLVQGLYHDCSGIAIPRLVSK